MTFLTVTSLTGLLLCGANNSSKNGTFKIGDRIPSLRFTNLEGAQIKSDADRPKLLLLLFLIHHGKASQRVIHDLKAIQLGIPERQRQSLTVKVVIPSQLQSEVENKIPKNWSLWIDPQRMSANKLGIIAFPTTVLIDQNQRLLEYLPLRGLDYKQRIETTVKHQLGLISEDEYQKLRQKGTSGTKDANGSKTRLWVSLALKIATEDSKKAEEYFRRALKKAPQSAEVSIPFASFLFELQRIDEASALIQAFLKKQPLHIDARLMKARLLIARQLDDDAEKILLSLLHLSPKKSTILCELGGILERRQDWKGAAARYRQALSILLKEKRSL